MVYVGTKIVGSQNSLMEASVAIGDWKLNIESKKGGFTKGLWRWLTSVGKDPRKYSDKMSRLMTMLRFINNE